MTVLLTSPEIRVRGEERAEYSNRACQQVTRSVLKTVFFCISTSKRLCNFDIGLRFRNSLYICSVYIIRMSSGCYDVINNPL